MCCVLTVVIPFLSKTYNTEMQIEVVRKLSLFLLLFMQFLLISWSLSPLWQREINIQLSWILIVSIYANKFLRRKVAVS